MGGPQSLRDFIPVDLPLVNESLAPEVPAEVPWHQRPPKDRILALYSADRRAFSAFVQYLVRGFLVPEYYLLVMRRYGLSASLNAVSQAELLKIIVQLQNDGCIHTPYLPYNDPLAEFI